MTQLRVLIVDDEPLARMRLQRQLGTIEQCSLVGEAADSESALLQVQLLDPDLILLDIEMPGGCGLALAQQLAARDCPPAIIFCTAHDEFALPAFATSAVGYLLKPVSIEQLRQAMAKVQRLSKPQQKLLQGTRKHPGRNRIKAVSRLGVELLLVNAIRCLIADSKYVLAHHPAGETILDESLKELEREFGARFVRVHRSTLVAREYIVGLRKEGGHYRVELEGVTEAPLVSRRMLSSVKTLIAEIC
ncbi:LytTR family DNA-binding domain-containing protein [Microbulbifer sp. 2205BS26-8]|uniref:LytR/AlgR family response regulator transcription factor n=1 Tax=Microbulbifer sp. 2205BS26-8 TaxID=3064386 RepID=UPI00273E3F9E|nr:LytTR family DNA-binding domain-containing protein [Microbulbifer sp. 2205BS26-8]MDP5209634.1 LytTR family DNA-binding domain-containing protein [Microbulbifer sp. 2205BS26-8]